MRTSDMIDSIAPFAPGAARATILDAIRWAQRELCVHGLAWIADEGIVVSGATTAEPEIDPPLGAVIIRVMSLADGSRELVGGLDYYVSAAGRVILRRIPNSDSLTGALSCQPAPGRDMPQPLLDRWANDIIVGAKSHLMAMPQPWKDPQRAEFHRLEFLSAQANAKAAYWSGHQAGSIRMRTPRFP